MVIIDGMLIYQKTHMFGFLSSIQAEAVKDLQVFKGGYPAKFGGRTSGLIGITNRVGNTETPRINFTQILQLIVLKSNCQYFQEEVSS